MKAHAVGRLAEEVLAKIDARDRRGEVSGVSTGFADLDRVLDRLHDGDLVVIAARPSMGKSTLALNIAVNVARARRLPVLVFSPVLPAPVLAARLLGDDAQLSPWRLTRGDLDEGERMRVVDACTRLKETPIQVFASFGLQLDDLERHAREAAAKGPLGLLYVQDPNLFDIPDLSVRLKRLAVEYDVPVLVTTGLRRQLEGRRDKRPRMIDLRRSSDVANKADVVLFLYRDEYYNRRPERRGLAEVIVAWQPTGLVGTVDLVFQAPYVRFEDPPALE